MEQERKILIVGASGLVGGNCFRLFTELKNTKVLGTYFSFPADSTIPYNTLAEDYLENSTINDFQPTHIIHAGALTHVDYCEAHVEESYQKTVQSTMNMIELAKKHSAQLIYISTDYVFDGQSGPYLEEEEVNPISVYAEHKLQAEQLAVQYGNSLSLRITNVYGDELRNKNFVSRIIDACKAGEKLHLRLPLDQYATPVNAWDVARAINVLTQDGHSGVFNIASTDFLNRIQLAERVLQHYPDSAITMEALKTSDLNQPAKRPLLGGLITAKFNSLYPNFSFGTVENYIRSKI